MSRRFVPPAVTAFGDSPDPGLLAVARAREEAFAEGHARGLEEGHAQGFAAGEAEGRAALQPAIDELCENLAKCTGIMAVNTAVDALLASRAADRAALDAAAGAAVASALRVAFPVLAASAAGAEIAALLTEVLTERAEESLTLRAAPATLEAVGAEGFPGTFADRLTLLPDVALPDSAAEIGWAGGGLTYDLDDLQARLNAVLSPGQTHTSQTQKELSP